MDAIWNSAPICYGTETNLDSFRYYFMSLRKFLLCLNLQLTFCKTATSELLHIWQDALGMAYAASSHPVCKFLMEVHSHPLLYFSQVARTTSVPSWFLIKAFCVNNGSKSNLKTQVSLCSTPNNVLVYYFRMLPLCGAPCSPCHSSSQSTLYFSDPVIRKSPHWITAKSPLNFLLL